VQKENKKFTPPTPPSKKNHKVCGKNNCDKSRASKFFKKFTEKQITRSLNCWCFTEFFFRSDNARSLPFVKNTEKTNKYLRSNLQNIRE